MKAYRTIGSILGSILMPVFIILLCACILVASIAGLITNKSISNIVENAMNNEDIKTSVSDVLVESIAIPGISDNPQMQNSVNQIMSLPSIQDMFSGIISNSASELTSGSFDGILDVQEIIQNALTSAPTLLPTVSSDIVDVIMQNDSLRDTIASTFLGDDASAILGDEMIDEIMQAPEVKKIFANMITGTIQTGLHLNNTSEFNIADEMENLISENPALVEDVMDALIPSEEAFQQAVADAQSYAQENGLPVPDANISKLEFAAYYVDLYGEHLNTLFQNADLNVDVDYTDYETPADTSEESLTLTFDEETVAMLNQAAEILNIFRSPLFILAILGVFIFYYLLMALFTWSFRYPLIFSGITAILTSLLLITIAALPIHEILNMAMADSAELLAISMITSIWGVLTKKIVIFGTVGIVLGITLITVFIITGILIKNKKAEAFSADASIPATPAEA